MHNSTCDPIVVTMSDHVTRPIERRCDVAVVGGSAAGLAAALQLGRQRRSVHDQGVVEARMGHRGAAHALLTLAHGQATSLGMRGWARAAASARARLDGPSRGRS